MNGMKESVQSLGMVLPQQERFVSASVALCEKKMCNTSGRN